MGWQRVNAPPPTNHVYWLMDQSLGARFWAKVNCAGTHQSHMKTCCWEWTGGGDGRGYGAIRVSGRMQKAHRLTLSWTVGRPLTKHALHHCDNPLCVRPSHLYEGTQLQNSKDAADRQRLSGRAGELNLNAKLTEASVKEIRTRAAAGDARPSLAKEYGVSVALISHVINRRAWKHVL